MVLECHTLQFTFFLLYGASYYANKYVLTVLNFTYPCIFQGWQTLVGMILLRALNATGHIELSDPDSTSLLKWYPATVCFVSAIYSGSKALSKLSLPIFFALQNVISFVNCTGDVVFHRQKIHLTRYLLIMVILGAAVLMVHYDHMFVPEGYFWMTVHIICMGMYNLYTSATRGSLQLGNVQKLYYCYVFSVIVLAPSSYFLGDAIEAYGFQFYRLNRFYVGCILSGFLGVFMNLTAVILRDTHGHECSNVEFVTAVSKGIASMASFAVFETNLSPWSTVWCTINLVASIFLSDANLYHRTSDVNTASSKRIVRLQDL